MMMMSLMTSSIDHMNSCDISQCTSHEGYKEQQNLVVLHGPDEAGQGHKEEEDAHANDTTYHLETGDQTEPLPPCCDADQQQTHHLQDRHAAPCKTLRYDL